jgi:hypothetical protein
MVCGRYHIISCGIINIKVIRYYRSWSQVIDSPLVVVDFPAISIVVFFVKSKS